MKKLISEVPYLEGEGLVLRRLEARDADPLKELTESPGVYRYLPTFLYEQKFEPSI